MDAGIRFMRQTLYLFDNEFNKVVAIVSHQFKTNDTVRTEGIELFGA